MTYCIYPKYFIKSFTQPDFNRTKCLQSKENFLFSRYSKIQK